MAATTPIKVNRRRSTKAASLPVIRDTSFCRAIVDKTVVVPLGRDLDVSCLQFGSELDFINDQRNAEEVKLKPAYSEVARLRLAWPEAANLAMQILIAGVERDILSSEKLSEIVASLGKKENPPRRRRVKDD